MRVRALILLSFFATTLALRADEVFPVLKVGQDVYSNVTVTSVTATDIYFTSDKGMANAKLKNLDPVLQRHFHFDSDKGAVVEKNQEPSGGLLADVANPAAKLSIGRGNAKTILPVAIARVKGIINQPVRSMRETADMLDVQTAGPAWFHPGSIKPDFEIVDVRKTQDLNYAQHPYYTSDLNPGIVFLGADMEFNSMTKYFYDDRSLPKKKLTEADMVEVNRLYRIIGKCENELDDHGNLRPIFSVGYMSLHKQEVITGTVGVLVLLVIMRFVLRRRPE